MKTHLILLVSFTVLCSCSVVQKSYKHSFADGYYRSRIFNEDQTKVYVENKDDSILVYSLTNDNQLNPNLRKVVTFDTEEQSNMAMNKLVFKHLSADLDFLTVLTKYRFANGDLPGQMNTNLNGAVFIGLRNDIYHMKYPKTPLNTYQRRITHYGFSVGFFSGFGGTPVNQWVTNDNVMSEYDGVTWINGFAGIIGIDRASFGLTLGWDNLLDTNKQYWIYQGKPWIGLAITLNIN
jgi:hypothetical protein